MVGVVEQVINPKKRVFLALVLVSAIVTAIILYLIWKVTFLGLASIVAWLPAAFGIFVAEHFHFFKRNTVNRAVICISSVCDIYV